MFGRVLNTSSYYIPQYDIILHFTIRHYMLRFNSFMLYYIIWYKFRVLTGPERYRQTSNFEKTILWEIEIILPNVFCCVGMQKIVFQDYFISFVDPLLYKTRLVYLSSDFKYLQNAGDSGLFPKTLPGNLQHPPDPCVGNVLWALAKQWPAYIVPNSFKISSFQTLWVSP